MSSKKEWRQAVVLIHGIGEQRPMETLRGFASNVLSRRTDGKQSARKAIRWFSKPDRLSETLELRRLSASPEFVTVPTDFYELYWAHLMQGTAWSHVGAWWQMALYCNYFLIATLMAAGVDVLMEQNGWPLAGHA